MPQKFTVKPLMDLQIWDQFVQNHPHGSVLYESIYLETLSKNFGFRPEIICVWMDNKLVAGIAMFSNKKWGYRIANRFFIQPYRPLLIQFPENLKDQKKSYFRNQVIGVLIPFLKRRLHAFTINTFPGEQDMRPYLWAGMDCRVYYTWVTPLSGKSPREFLKTRKLRRLKEMEKNFSIEPSTDWALAARLSEENDRRKGRKPGVYNEQNILAFLLALQEKLSLFFIRDAKGSPWGCRIMLRDYQKILDYVAASSPHSEYLDLQRFFVSHLLVKWSAGKQGLFDFAGIYEENIARFKEHFIGSIIPFYSLSWAAPGPVRWLQNWRRLTP